jgi:hypothetical protein
VLLAPPAGVARQLAAILTTPDRTTDLTSVAVPCLVDGWATTFPTRCGRSSSSG